MSKEEITKWNVLDGLRNNEEIAAYLEAALEDGDYAFFLSALNDATHAFEINTMAKKTGGNRQSLYKNFDKGSKPNFETVFKAIDDLDLRLAILPKNKRGKHDARVHPIKRAKAKVNV
ncbi:MAG: putative addiction module antidote protein [Leptospirales bacterium]|nr:putative addiction module antidote protein [Leptospirales bacterium]